jgi:broad specificity phosphatase PhoE
VNDDAQAGSESEPAFVAPGLLPDHAALWLIRHGETEWSRDGQHTSRTDLPLTPHGEAQARALRGLLHDLRPAFVLTSPRRRSTQTAQLAGLHVDVVDPDLVEWDYGAYEGLTSAQIQQQVPGWTVFSHPSPGGETLGQVRARADRVLTRIMPRLAGGPVVLITHGHFSRVLGARWIGLGARGGARLALGTAAPSLLGALHGLAVIDHWNLPNPAVKQGD